VLNSLALCGHLDGDRHLRTDLERDLPLLRDSASGCSTRTVSAPISEPVAISGIIA